MSATDRKGCNSSQRFELKQAGNLIELISSNPALGHPADSGAARGQRKASTHAGNTLSKDAQKTPTGLECGPYARQLQPY